MIDIVPVWERGYFGTGIRVRINDNGLALDHVEFENRIDKDGSCDNGLYLPRGNHGTNVASIVGGGSNNGICSVGISPNVTLSACDAFNITVRYDVLQAKLHSMDISQNSWGTSACFGKRQRRNNRNLQENDTEEISLSDASTGSSSNCPFSYMNVFTVNPCEVCNFTTSYSLDSTDANLRQRCETTIRNHCSRFYEHDPKACVEYIDLLVDGGECEYNTLLPSDRDALIAGVTEGRDGKGIIYVFAAGNDYNIGADTNFEGLINTRLTISVGAVGKDGLHASYSTPGAALFVSGPGGDYESRSNFVTAAAGGPCFEAGAGTSFACPVVSGVVALMLEANSNLTWRDVQGILASTSRITNDPDDDSLVTNAAGYKHSNFYGFGIVNANMAVRAAETWDLFPPEEILEVPSGLINIRIADLSSTLPSSAISTVTLSSSNFEFDPSMKGFFTESVMLLLDIRHFSRGDLDITLTSPAGTKSLLHPGKRPETTQLDIDERWKLMTVRSWGESPFGNWTLSVTDAKSGDVAQCVDHLWSLEADDGFDVTCDFFENNGYCENGTVDEELLAQSSGEFIFNVTDEDFGLNFVEACCACGGGRRRGDDDFGDMVVQWLLVVYGHSTETKNSVAPSDAPSLVPSGVPTDVPSASPAPSIHVTDPLQDLLPNLGPFTDSDKKVESAAEVLISGSELTAILTLTCLAILLVS